MDELHPGQTFAGYRIEAVVGRGGMGVVYRATQITLDRTVALKLIIPPVAQDVVFRKRLQRESKLLASIDHPNVITFYEAGEAEGQLFMSMRYVEGMDLRSLIAQTGPLAPERAARITAQVAAGLDAAHAGGLVHRDVKPANVLVEQRDGTERAYLSDFGLTKNVQLATAITGTGQWVGSSDYVAPEQIVRPDVDGRADVYALGCVLFEALTGQVPYVRAADAGKLWAHLHAAAPSACAVRPELPAGFDRVIARAMAKDPARRYPSAGALGRAAIAAAGGEELTVAAEARRPTDATDATDAAGDDDGAAPAGRRRRPFAIAAVVALVASTATVAAVLRSKDPAPGPQPRVEHFGLGKPAVVGELAADARGAYVLDTAAGTVVRLDTSGTIAGSVKVGRSPVDIAVDDADERAWVTDRKDRTISEVDTRRMRLVGRPFHVQPKPSLLAVLPDELVVLSAPPDNFGRTDGRLLRIGKQSHRRIGKIEQLRAYAPDLVVSGKRVAVSSGLPPSLTIYGPRLTKVARHELDQDLATGAIATLEAVAIDRSVAWALFTVVAAGTSVKVRFGTILPGAVLRVNLATGKQIGTTIPVGRLARDIAVADGAAWIPSLSDESVTRIDTRSGRRIGKPIKIGPNNGAVAAGGGVAWVGGATDVIRITAPCAPQAASGAKSCS